MIHRSQRAARVTFLLVLAGLALMSVVVRTSAAAPATEFECRWAESPIVIDGKPDEAAWKNAQVIDRFYLPWLGKNARRPAPGTKARLLWDRDYFYFAAEMEDTLDLVANVTEHNGETWKSTTSSSCSLKPAVDKPGYYEFQVTAAGTVLDLFLPQRGAGGYKRFKNAAEFHVDAKVHLEGTLNKWQDKDTGWSVEGRIPWGDFLHTGGRPEASARAGSLPSGRYDYSVDFEGPELSTCAPLKTKATPDFHFFEDYATLKFVGPGANGAGKPFGIGRRTPLTSSRVVGSPDPPPPYRVRRMYPKLKMSFPISVTRQPGAGNLIVVTQLWPYGPAIASTASRTFTTSNVDTVEKLFDVDGVAYDVKFHPHFADNGYVYVGSNGPLAGAAKTTRVIRYTMDRKPPYALDPKSATLIIEWPSDGHNGGAMAFGHDGMLYVTSGDGTSDSDRNIVGQDMTKLLAKVLRIDVDHPESGKTYAVPKDNPFVGAADVRPETWAYGLRNPWRMTVDDQTGHVWVGQNGQDLWEQAYLIQSWRELRLERRRG